MSDSKLLKKIQDYFCMVNGIYLSCLTKKGWSHDRGVSM